MSIDGATDDDERPDVDSPYGRVSAAARLRAHTITHLRLSEAEVDLVARWREDRRRPSYEELREFKRLGGRL